MQHCDNGIDTTILLDRYYLSVSTNRNDNGADTVILNKKSNGIAVAFFIYALSTSMKDSCPVAQTSSPTVAFASTDMNAPRHFVTLE